MTSTAKEGGHDGHNDAYACRVHAVAPRPSLNSHHVTAVVDTSRTRYHVVRAAARMLGWLTHDADRTDIPDTFFGYPLRVHNQCDLADSEVVVDAAPVSAEESESEGGRRSAAVHPPSAFHTTCLHSSAERALGTEHGTSASHTGREPRRVARHAVSLRILWLDTSVSSGRLSDLRGGERLNHFTGMHVIARKAVLFRRLTHLCSTAHVPPHAAAALRRFTPRSFSSRKDYAALCAYSSDAAVRAGGVYFIIKPGQACMGKGIRLTREPVEELTVAERTTAAAECVVQEYMARPLLVHGRKFDIRLYVLLTAVSAPPRHAHTRPNFFPASLSRVCRTATITADEEDGHTASSRHAWHASSSGEEKMGAARSGATVPRLRGVRLYLHREGLLRLCADRYATPTQDNCRNKKVHLTNYAVNKQDDVAGDDESRATAEQTHVKHRLSFLRDYINALPPSEVNHDDADEEEERQNSYDGDDNDRACGGNGATRWDKVWRRITECVALTVLSGVPVLRRELQGARAGAASRTTAVDSSSHTSRDSPAVSHDGRRRSGCSGVGADWHRCCFELLGFDIMLESRTLQPKLMEVNHSPSLFCDTELDFAVKSAVVADTLRLVASSESTRLAATGGFEQVLPLVPRCTTHGACETAQTSLVASEHSNSNNTIQSVPCKRQQLYNDVLCAAQSIP